MRSYQFCSIIPYSQYSIFLFWCGPKSRKHMTRSPKASPSPRVELALELANHSKRFSDEAEDSSEARGTWDPTGYCYWFKSKTQMIRGPLQFASSAEEKIKTAENKVFWPFWSGVYCLRCVHFLCEPTCTGNKAWLHFGRWRSPINLYLKSWKICSSSHKCYHCPETYIFQLPTSHLPGGGLPCRIFASFSARDSTSANVEFPTEAAYLGRQGSGWKTNMVLLTNGARESKN